MKALAESARFRTPNRQLTKRKRRATKNSARATIRHVRSRINNSPEEQPPFGTAPSANERRFDTVDACFHKFIISSPFSQSVREVVIQLDPDRTNRAALQCLILEAIRKIDGNEIAQRYEQIALIDYVGMQNRRIAPKVKDLVRRREKVVREQETGN
jgi:hypothetical protein